MQPLLIDSLNKIKDESGIYIMFIRYRENMRIAMPEIKRIDSQQDSMYMYNKKKYHCTFKEKSKKALPQSIKKYPFSVISTN